MAGLMNRLWGVPGRAGRILLLGLLLAAILAGPAFDAEIHVHRWYSVSPENVGDGGSSSFYADLSRRRPNVVLGGPDSVSAYVRAGYKVLYIILGPDKGFTAGEADRILSAYTTGRLRVLDADDLGVTAGLLEKLGAPTPVSMAVNPRARGEWRYILTIECDGVSGPASEARVLVVEEGAQPLCRYREGGGVAAAWVDGPGWGGVLVVGDASIFSNFLYKGTIQWLGSSKRLAWLLAYRAGVGEADVVVLDNRHYNASTYHYRGHYGVLLLSAVSTALASSMGSFSSRQPAAAGLVVSGLVLALAAIFTNPTRGLLAPPSRRLSRAEEAALESLLERLEASFERGTLGAYRPEDAARLARAAFEAWRRRRSGGQLS